MSDYLAKNPKRRERRTRLVSLVRKVIWGFVLLALFAAAGYWAFMGWRARDLALKARDNLEKANYRMAWVQARSARDLRPSEPEVLRASAIIDAAFGRKESLVYWRQLAEVEELGPEEQEQRARAALRFGDTREFEAATSALESSGRGEAVARLRATEKLSRGDLIQAIEEARRGAALSGDARFRLDLARLLLRRYVDELAASPGKGSPAAMAFAEMTAIVDSLQDDPEISEEALGFGLTFLLPGPETQKRWADRAMKRMEPGNVALLPAATVFIDNKYDTAENQHRRLRPIFDGAPLDRRAAYSAWLTRHGMPREALTMITEKEAGEGQKSFSARIEALIALGNWPAVLATVEQGGNVPQTLQLLAKARAEYAQRGGATTGASSVASSLRAAVREGLLSAAVPIADGFGAQRAVSDALVQLSGEPSTAQVAFRLARERFGAAGDHDRMLAAFEGASVAAPEDVAVRDHARYAAMIADAKARPDLEEAAMDAAAEPGNPLVRVTQSLALLRGGKPQEALEVFDNITVFYDRLPPGPQAVVCAVLAANDQVQAARSMAAAIDVTKLEPGEQALIENLR